MNTRTCTKCNLEKPLSEFRMFKQAKGVVRHRRICVACANQKMRENYAADPESYSARTKRRQAAHPLYGTWYGMMQRTTNPQSPDYPRAGGRGITVCDRWKSYETFAQDIEDRPSPHHKFSRIDPNGNYEPGNVHWASKAVTFKGVTNSLAGWAEERGIAYQTLRMRLHRLGWSVERALTEPVRRSAADGGDSSG